MSRRVPPFTLLLMLLALALPLSSCGGESSAGADGAADSTGAAASAGEDGTASGDAGKDGGEESPPKRRETTVTVDAGKVVRGDLVIPVIAEGAVRARNAADIRAEISGRIEKVRVVEGQRVAKGQLILELDDREYRVALTEAQNQYLEALGRLALEDETLDSRAAGDRLLEDLAAIEDLLRQGTITQREYQDRKIQMEVEAVKQGARRGDLVQVRSGLAGARAAQDRAQLNLEQTEIRAPFAGVVSNLGLTAGQHLNLGDVVCDIVDNVNLEAEVAVLESDLKGLETGRPVRLQIPAIGDTLDVTVDVMSPRIDPVSRTCNLLMRFKNDAGRIRPGMFVRASIAGDIYPDRLMVPREAILTRDGRPMLFRIENERAKWVYVELGPFNDRFIEIAKVIQGGPLEPGALAVISDHLTLTHDAKVKVRKVVATQFAWAIPPDED